MWGFPKCCSRSVLKWTVPEGDSPVDETVTGLNPRRVVLVGNPARIWVAIESKAKYNLSPIAQSTAKER